MVIAPVDSTSGVMASADARAARTKLLRSERREQPQRHRGDQRHAEPDRIGVAADRAIGGGRGHDKHQRRRQKSEIAAQLALARSRTSIATSAAPETPRWRLPSADCSATPRAAAASRARHRARSARSPDRPSRTARARNAARSAAAPQPRHWRRQARRRRASRDADARAIPRAPERDRAHGGRRGVERDRVARCASSAPGRR